MDRIALGSGKLYCVLYSGTIPNDAAIETADNLLERSRAARVSNIRRPHTKPLTIAASGRKPL